MRPMTKKQESQNAVTFNGKTYTLDAYGFLNPPEQWDEAFAEGMAREAGIFGGMTDQHWDFIRYLRKKFLEEQTVPVVVLACAENKLRLSDFNFLFPTGYHRGACRIAGINYDFMYQTNYWLTYETSSVLKKQYSMTPLGFLKDFHQWDERFAHLVVREWKLAQGLTERHREIIDYLRTFYQNTGNIPSISEACTANGLSLEELRSLFPEGYRRGACRIAGLPFLA